MDINVRDATEADLPAVVDIYNQSIPGGLSTADTRPIAVADRVDWFRKHDPSRRPLWVAELDGAVVAWISVSSFYGGRPMTPPRRSARTLAATTSVGASANS